MRIYQHRQLCNISEKVKHAEQQLKNNRVYTIVSAEHIDHVAAYLAWKNVGGNVFIKSPLLPFEQSAHVMSLLEQTEVADSLIFHTSGTTGYPKLVIHTQKQLDSAILLSSRSFNWNKDTNALNLMPAFTSGFWHIMITAAVYYDCALTLGTKETAIDDINDRNCNMMVSGTALFTNLKARRALIDFKHYQYVGIGASAVNQNHVEYLFDLGVENMVHCYGSTEMCTPILHRVTNSPGNNNEYLNLDRMSFSDAKLVNGELYVKSSTLCENYKEFRHVDDWFCTGDLFEQQGDLIKFIGRTNEIVKINGHSCNLLLIENAAEERTDLGECMAVPRHTAGVDWIELLYTNNNAVINRNNLDNIFETVLTKYDIPRKYTFVDELPKNGFGKKIRYG